MKYGEYEVLPEFTSGGAVRWRVTGNGEYIVARKDGKKWFVKRDIHLRYPARSVPREVFRLQKASVEARERKQERLRKAMEGTDCEKAGIGWAVPTAKHQQGITSVIYDDIKQGRRANMPKFAAAVADLKAQGCDMAVLGCTELSLVKRDEHLDRFFIDSTEVLCRHALLACGVTPIGFDETGGQP